MRIDPPEAPAGEPTAGTQASDPVEQVAEAAEAAPEGAVVEAEPVAATDDGLFETAGTDLSQFGEIGDDQER